MPNGFLWHFLALLEEFCFYNMAIISFFDFFLSVRLEIILVSRVFRPFYDDL